jgi:hypothetical protein
MISKFTKTAAVLVLCFFMLTGCGSAIQSLTNVGVVSGKIQVEQKKQADKTLATIKCQELCQNAIASSDQDLDKGPCLSNEVIADWVCDVAHVPRQPVDDEAANQCSAFRTGQAHHFVEVDGNCNVLKVY